MYSNYKSPPGGRMVLIGSQQSDMIYMALLSLGTSQSVKARPIQINHFLRGKEDETALKSLSNCSLL